MSKTQCENCNIVTKELKEALKKVKDFEKMLKNSTKVYRKRMGNGNYQEYGNYRGNTDTHVGRIVCLEELNK